MKETIELRINYDYANLLFKADEGKKLGTSVKVVELLKNDPRYNQVPIIAKKVKQKYDEVFFFGWEIKRKYSKKELDTAPLLHIKIKSTFEPAGEECGTLYDETVACEICGAKRKQRSPLRLKYGSVPKKDIARTIAGEVVVSEKFATAFKQKGLKGLIFEPVVFDKGASNYYQLVASTKIELSQSTVAGINPFDLSASSEREIYKCPKGHTLGLNLLSEAYVLNSQSITENDFFSSKQQIGVKRGLLRPEPLYFCSPAFREMVEEEMLSGFDFEIAHIQ
ncbi:hypothetical protein [Gelidibacter salicanalis]|uniref:Uncharacterized protein n=1 Tax=Gelidibacter salicanalis TaxID=291193 RepID=A0A934KQV3_9FLAO|nr:hypothetical protein [Gelidibacter salicanalis]MBJ7880430.1 hypothetical protein [Gelidibacter salicanalis]